jgi:hypothetical protein
MRVNLYLDAYGYSSDSLYIRIFDGEGINLLIGELGACSEFLLCDRNNTIQFKYLLKRCLEANGSAVVKIRTNADECDVEIKPLDYNSGKLLSIDNFQSFLEIIDNYSHSRGLRSRKSKIIEMLLNGSLSEYYFIPEKQEKKKNLLQKKKKKLIIMKEVVLI